MFNFVVVVKFGRAIQNPICVFPCLLTGGACAGGSGTLAGARRVAQLFGADNVFIMRGVTYNKLFRKKR